METVNSAANVADEKEEKIAQVDDFHCNMWGHGSLDMNYVEGMKSGDAIRKVFSVAPNALLYVVLSEDKTCLRFIWQMKHGLKTKTKLMQEIYFEDTKLPFDYFKVIPTTFVRDEELDEETNTGANDYVFGETVIGLNGLTNTVMYGTMKWVGDAEDITFTKEEYDPCSVLGGAITYRTGIFGNIYGELLLVGGENGFEPIKSTNPEISDTDKKYIYQVLKPNEQGWEVIQQDFLPDGWGADSADLCYNLNKYDAVCVCIDNGEGVVLCFDRRNDKYECRFSHQISHPEHLSLVGKEITGIQSGVWSTRVLVELSFEDEAEISDYLLMDSQTQKMHSLDFPPLHRGNIKCITYYPGESPYSGIFGFGCCDYGEQEMALCTWDQVRVIFIAMYKKQPSNCIISRLPMDVFGELCKFLTKDKKNPFFGPQLPANTHREENEKEAIEEPNVKCTHQHQKPNTPTKPHLS